MKVDRSEEIKEIVERESRAFETADAKLMLTIYHPDMVWAWPPHAKAHDPMEWLITRALYFCALICRQR